MCIYGIVLTHMYQIGDMDCREGAIKLMRAEFGEDFVMAVENINEKQQSITDDTANAIAGMFRLWSSEQFPMFPRECNKK